MDLVSFCCCCLRTAEYWLCSGAVLALTSGLTSLVGIVTSDAMAVGLFIFLFVHVQ